MKTVNMHEAKTHLSRLVEGAVKGEPFIIARAGKPLVEVRAVEAATRPQRSWIGVLEGRFPPIPDDFDTMMADEIRDLFEGKEDNSSLWRPRPPAGEEPGQAGPDESAA